MLVPGRVNQGTETSFAPLGAQCVWKIVSLIATNTLKRSGPYRNRLIKITGGLCCLFVTFFLSEQCQF